MKDIGVEMCQPSRFSGLFLANSSMEPTFRIEALILVNFYR
jgi:hypothetical protein